MGYRRALLLRWSRRDRLAVLVVAVTVAFLVGTVLLVLAAGAQTTAIAAEYDAPGFATAYDTPDAARAAAAEDALVLPIAEVSLPDGSRAHVVGRPADAPLARDLGLAGRGTTLGTLAEPRTVRLAGGESAVAVQATPRDGSILPPEWILAPPETVDRLGPTGAIVIRPPDGGFDRGTPLRSALVFFLLGTRQALSTLTVAALGGGLLVGVTVYSVTRMSVRDRLAAIRVIRATGAAPRTVLGLFALRATLLAGAGAALGYALGVILPNAAVSLAVTAGLPTSLDVAVTARAARVLAPILGGVVAIGALAGGVAAWPAARRHPGRLTDATSRTAPADGATHPLRARFRTTLLGWRALVPTTATLTAFVLFAVLVAGAAGVVGPLASADATTITAPDAAHPFTGSVPEAYADALRAEGEHASPEILLLSAADGRPFVARGAPFAAFANVTPATLERGRAPGGDDEAVVGEDLAASLGVSPGDRLLLGGSSRTGLARVRVVGTFSAPGPFDDQLVVPLATARHLAELPPGRVRFVRASGLPEGAVASATVAEVSAPGRVRAGEDVAVRITLRNVGADEVTTDLPVRFDDAERRVRIALAPGAVATETVSFGTDTPGAYRLRAGDVNRTIDVVDPDAIEIRVPDRAPPGSEPLVSVVDAVGSPANATVTVENRSAVTGSDGSVRVPLDAPGNHTVTAERGDQSATAHVHVEEGVARELDATLDVRPEAPTLFVRPEARLLLFNPWNRTLAGAVTIEGPDGRVGENVSVAPGERTTVSTRFARRPPGTYDVRATLDGRVVGTTTYAVTGDERLVSALAASGRTSGTGIGRAIETAFGNLRIVLGVVLALAGLMTAGGTTATFAAAVHARRRTVGVYRATGAGPARLLRIVLADALLVGGVATGLALVLGIGVLRVLAAAGHLTVFGVALSPIPSARVIVGIAAGALGLTLAGAALALAGLLVARPTGLLGEGRTPSGTDRG